MSSEALDRSRVPSPNAIRPFDVPATESTRLENGLDLRVARMSRLPLVSVNLVFVGGETPLDRSSAGLAALTGETLDGGTVSRNGEELARALEEIGAHLGTTTGWDATTVRLSCLADRLPEAFGLLSEVVRHASFPEKEIERSRDQRLAKIRQRRMDPSSFASDEAARLIYAEDVPYGRPLAGLEASISGVDRDAVTAFATDRYRPRGSGLVVVGDVDSGEIAQLVQDQFGDWTGSPPAPPEAAADPRDRRRTVHIVHREGSVQSEIRVGHPGVPKNTSDHFPLVVANTVLGGAFTSRLNLNLRERHGFTYGVRSRFSFRRGAGPFSVATAVATEATAAAVGEVLAELTSMAEAGPTEDETRAARDYVAGVFPLQMETAGQVAAHLAELVVFDLPEDWLVRYRDRVRAVDRETAAEAVRRHVRPAEAQVVIVGDAAALTAPLEDLSIGPVVVHEGQG
jgi:zinc protease